MLSTVGSKELTHRPMSCAHPATSLPLIIVSVIETLRIGDSNPAMPLFAQKYPSNSSMNSWALAQLPVNIWGSVPMVLMSLGAAAGTRPWAMVAGVMVPVVVGWTVSCTIVVAVVVVVAMLVSKGEDCCVLNVAMLER